VASRVVLLGASNLTMGLPLVLGAARARLPPGPLEIFVAAGHGRSYGRWSHALVRGLPAIRDCGLWAALDRGGAPTHALVTDIGNDIAYGATPVELAGWIEACLARLAGQGVRSIVTLLPAASLARLPRWQYHVFKTVLFPGRRLPFPLFHARLAEANARLGELAARHGTVTVAPSAEWYRADAIHLAARRRAAAWLTILGSWGTARDASGPVGYRGLAPAWRTVCGVSLRRAQPSTVLPDGTQISLY
jgi:hypothetical protein